MEQLPAIFDLLISTFRESKVLREEKSQRLRNPIVNSSVEMLHKEDSSAGVVNYSSTKKLFLEYMKRNSGKVWSTSRRAELDVWLW